MVAIFTAEAEYISVASSLQTGTTLHKMILQRTLWDHRPMSIKFDNKSTVEMINKPHGTKRRNFIDLRHHYIRQKLDDCQTRIKHVPAAEQKADMFTIPVRRVAFQRECRILCISNHQIGRTEVVSSSQGACDDK